MANPNHVGSRTQRSFGSYLIAANTSVSLNATGNAVAVMPILSGGTGGSTQFIIRRITVANLANSAGGAVSSAATANVSIGTTNDGANLLANAQTTTNLTGASGFADLVLSATANASTSNANALFVNVVANAVTSHTVTVSVYGDIVTF